MGSTPAGGGSASSVCACSGPWSSSAGRRRWATTRSWPGGVTAPARAPPSCEPAPCGEGSGLGGDGRERQGPLDDRRAAPELQALLVVLAAPEALLTVAAGVVPAGQQ